MINLFLCVLDSNLFLVIHFLTPSINSLLEKQVNLLYVLELCIFLKYANINWDFKFSFCDNVTCGIYLCVFYSIKIPYFFLIDNWWLWKHLSLFSVIWSGRSVMCMCGQVSMWLYFTYFVINYYTFEDLVYKISLMFDIQV